MLRRVPRPRVLVAFVVVTIAVGAASFAAGLLLRGGASQAFENSQTTVEVTAEAGSSPLPAVSAQTVVSAESIAKALAFVPDGATVALATDVRNVGDVIAEGERVASISGRIVVALNLRSSHYRDMGLGQTGPDVQALNDALVRIGAMAGPAGSSYTDATAGGVATMYSKAGATAQGNPTGSVLPYREVLALSGSTAVVTTAVASGVVAEPGETVLEASLPPTQLTARVDVLTGDNLVADAPVSITELGSGTTFTGKVGGVSEFREGATVGDQKSIPGFDVAVVLDETAQAELTPGASVSLSFEATSEEYTTLPLQAMREHGEVTSVWKMGSSSYSSVEVKVVRIADGLVFIEANPDLSSGDTVSLTR